MLQLVLEIFIARRGRRRDNRNLPNKRRQRQQLLRLQKSVFLELRTRLLLESRDISYRERRIDTDDRET